MKKLFPLLFSIMMALLIFVAPGNQVKAAETNEPVVSDEDCSCHNVTPVLGDERNKMVAALISSEAFKTVKMEYTAEGHQWLGASDIEILIYNADGRIFIGVPFNNQEGALEMVVFINGAFAGIVPME